MKGDMKPAVSEKDAPMKCLCGWRGLLTQTVRAAVNPKTGSYVAMCPQCKTFRLQPEA